ncbi:MAG: calcium-binding EGF-like domain-containing protein [Bacteroidia bacterium]|nr:calcium-binding EGF-like domain-containing protein [Bacteroidia bacterium]MDW8133935.1 calcium-binding EGF-like domain-containing protein [Bacteroidia bacterium]
MRKGSLVIWSIATAAITSACKRGSCEGVICLNGGYCRNGRCVCPVGFGGTQCERKWTDNWVGTYTVDDRCRTVGMIPQYDAQITASPIYPDVIYFEGFGDIRCEGQKIRVEGRLTSTEQVEIYQQSSCNRRYTLWGSARLEGTSRTISVEYYFRDFQTDIMDTCRAVWSRY